jgi:hypothetical protein
MTFRPAEFGVSELHVLHHTVTSRIQWMMKIKLVY